MRRCVSASTAGAKNAHICHRITGSASASAAQKLTITEMMNGSATPKVAGRLCCTGSGAFSQSSSWLWKTNVTMKAAPTAIRQ